MLLFAKLFGFFIIGELLIHWHHSDENKKISSRLTIIEDALAKKRRRGELPRVLVEKTK